MKNKTILILAIILIATFSISGCSKSGKTKKFDTQPVSIKQYDFPPGADKNVSAENGGEGFKGEGWETKEEYNTSGYPDAVKGGSLVLSLQEFPVTLRTEGKDANNAFLDLSSDILYETLLRLDPVTMEYIPGLATHWKISDDKVTYKFRLNPDARWADGKPVTSEDIIATWKILVDPGILMPYTNSMWSSFEEPVMESKYIFSVKTKVQDWRQFFYFSQSLKVLPAHYIGNMSGKEYLEKYQFEYIPGSGPYIIDKNEIKKGEYITIRRRNDYWAEEQDYNKGLNNFDLIRVDIIQNESLELEKFKKGEIDLIWIRRTQWWEEKLNTEEVNRGLILKRRIYNEFPNGVSGICLNMRKYPFDDIRIRKAFAYLYDREKFNEKLFFNAYLPINSYFPGTANENPNNPKIKYNFDSARSFLEQAGWKEKNSEGYLIKDGRILEIEMPFVKGQDRFLTIYQEDLKKAGVKLNLKESDFNIIFKLGNELNFTALPMSWSGTFIPNPESYLKSETADSMNTLNWPGIKDKKIDELCDLYKITFSQNDRIKIIREIDSIACEYQGYVFGWYAPYHRIAFQNKFGYPEWVLNKIGNYLGVTYLWYNDPEKIAEYDAARKDNAINLPGGTIDSKYWLLNKIDKK